MLAVYLALCILTQCVCSPLPSWFGLPLYLCIVFFFVLFFSSSFLYLVSLYSHSFSAFIFICLFLFPYIFFCLSASSTLIFPICCAFFCFYKLALMCFCFAFPESFTHYISCAVSLLSGLSLPSPPD